MSPKIRVLPSGTFPKFRHARHVDRRKVLSTSLLPDFQVHRHNKSIRVVGQQQPAALRTRSTNRLNPENNRGIRNVPLPNTVTPSHLSHITSLVHSHHTVIPQLSPADTPPPSTTVHNTSYYRESQTRPTTHRCEKRFYVFYSRHILT